MDWYMMGDNKYNSDLNRFLTAQESDYQQALSEIKSGRKQSHWMWYIFPQYKGLGLSSTSKFYAINSLEEAKAYLSHPVLGTRLREITAELLKLENTDANQIFGSPDDMKLRSCMTLFSIVNESDDDIFQRVIDKYFDCQSDKKTIKLIKSRVD